MRQLSFEVMRKSRRGRPRGRTTVPHDRRPEVESRFPHHVTLRVHEGVPSLSCAWLVKVVRGAIRDSHKPEFRIVQFNAC